MANPAFMLNGVTDVSTGEFGLDDFGDSPFGGNLPERYELPVYHLGSDNLQKDLRKKASRIVQRRGTKIISVRTEATWPFWAVRFNVILESELPKLEVYFDAGVFKLLPDGSPDSFKDVLWIGEFDPKYLGPGKYSLAFDLEEI